jgi:hypothetical protein
VLTHNFDRLQGYCKKVTGGFMDELIKKFNLNINRIRKANQYFKNNKVNAKAEQELNNIIMDCNDICNKLQGMGFDLNKLNMDIT